MDECASNPETSSTTKTGEHISCGYWMSTIWELDLVENEYTLYCRKYCMKKFCKTLRKNAKNITDFEKKE